VSSEPASGSRLGYVALERDGSACRGAMVVLTVEGDPVDLVYTDPVAISRITEGLLGPRLDAYLLARVMMEPLTSQAREKPSILCFDEAGLLLRRLATEVPAVVLADAEAAHRADYWRLGHVGGRGGGREPVWVDAASRDGGPLALLDEARRAMAPFGLRDPFRQLHAAIAALAKEGTR